MFVVAVGLGPVAGVVAIFVHNLGVRNSLPKRSNQSRELQEVVFGVVMPLWSSLTLYRLETNVMRRRLHHRPPRYSSTQAGDALA